MGFEKFCGSGMWIFPMIMMIIMMLFVFGVFGRRGFRPPWSQGFDRHDNENTGSETALDILKKRFAKGEITKDEFEQMKKDLKG